MSEAVADEATAPERPTRFLVVDDSATMRRIIVNTLRRLGYTETVEAADGQEALALFDESVLCVITDWNMPTMNGAELAKALRARSNGAEVPILMATSRSAREDIISAIEVGVSNYVVKPFTPQVLKDKLDLLLTGTAGGVA
ncbi:MAG: response regulator [Gemmatimonadetes bacterium]|nr:response regulator [Gemmatimonadota bacterium]